MAITDLEKGLFTDGPRLVGEVPGKAPTDFSVTKATEDDITFGQAVMEGTNPEQGLLVDGASAVFIGVARWSKDASKEDSSQEGNPIDGYKANDSMAVIQNGFINVKVVEAVSENDPVRFVHTGAGKGDFRTTADAGNTSLLTGAIFKTTTAINEVASIQLGGLTSFVVTDDV